MRWRCRHLEGVTIGWAVLCCGEHLFSDDEVRMHNERFHPKKVD